MPKFTVMLIETFAHRVVIEAATEAVAMHAAETILTDTDYNDDHLLVASGTRAIHTVHAAETDRPATRR